MTQPTPYNRQFSFTNDQTSNPSTKTPGNQLDAEFNAILTSFSQVLANLVLIQRDDGQITNSSVGLAQLKPEVSVGVAPATTWATSTPFAANATVFFNLQLYRCITPHISGVFATDLAAGRWVLIADFTTAITAATAGVISLGGLTGAFTLNGGGLSSNVLPVARYDAVQSLNASQQLQLANNLFVPTGAGAQSMTGAQQAQAASNIGAISGGAPQSLAAGVQAQAATNIGVASGAAAQSLSAGVQVQLANNAGVPSVAGAQALTPSQALQARSNLLMSTEIGKIEQWPTSDLPAGRLRCNGSSISRTTFADLFSAVVKSGGATFTNASTTVGMVAHGRSVGDNIKLFTSGTLPTNFSAGTHGLITAGTSYYIASVIDANNVTLATSAGGSAITAGSAGSGVHTWVHAPFGDGDGATTFTAPDFRGYFLRAWDNGAGTDTNRSIGTQQADQMIAHTHVNTLTDPGHFHTMKGSSGVGGAIAAINGAAGSVGEDDKTANATTGITLTNASAGAGTETRPKNYAVNHTIRYAA